MRISRLLATLVVAACVVVAFHLWSERQPSTEVAQPPVTPSERHQEDLVEERLPSSPQVARLNEIHAAPVLPATDLPPLDDTRLPLAQQLKTLVERAERGDPTAACRLVVDSQKCRAVSNRIETTSRIESSMTRESGRISEDLQIALIAGARERMASAEQYCAGVESSSFRSIDDLPAAAVANMSVRQRVLLALMGNDGTVLRLPLRLVPSSRVGRSTSYVQSQFLADHAYKFLQQGVEAADPLALEGMLMVHLPVWLPGSDQQPRMSSPNPERFAFYGHVMRGVFGPEALGEIVGPVFEGIVAELPPRRSAEVAQAASRESARWQRVLSSRGSSAGSPGTEIEDSRICLD